MKRTWIIAGGIVILVLILGAAAYVGGTLLNTQAKQPSASGGQAFQLSSGGGAPQKFTLDIQPAPEVASLGPTILKGLFVRRSDNSLFVGTGNVKMMAVKGQDGKVSTSAQYDGPVVEVVVGHDTQIYRDVTMQQFNGPPPAGQKTQQVLEPGTIDEIGENSTVQVWGTKTGDRATASVLVYSLPSIIKKP